MADISTITVAGTQYNFKDVSAVRSTHTHSYLPLSGGTLTGSVTVGGDMLTSGNALIVSNANSMSISSENATCCHFTSSKPVLFNKSVHIDGDLSKYQGSKVLYVAQNICTSTSNGTLTLSSSAANFTNMRIIFYATRDSITTYDTVEIRDPNNKEASLYLCRRANNDSAINTAAAVIKISGTSITRVDSGVAQYGGNSAFAGDNNVYISRVQAWNE